MNVPKLPPRSRDSHKGTYGTVLVVGGSRGMTGAPALTGTAALRSGAGLVRVAVPDCCLETVAGFEPCYTTIPLPCTEHGRLAPEAERVILTEAEQATVVAMGPGLGQSDGLRTLIGRIYRELDRPLVLDADGLNNLAGQPEMHHPAGPRILTPHPGEFARLLGRKSEPEESRRAAVELAAQWNVVLVLKGHGTLVTDGRDEYVNDTGNPGMATGGTGDLLTGMIAALVAQGLVPLDAARLGVYLHGMAGDLAAEEYGQVPIIASDLFEFFPDVFEVAVDDVPPAG